MWMCTASMMSPKRTMSSPPECGPAAVTSVPETTSASAAGTSARASHADPSGDSAVAPRAKLRAPCTTTSATASATRESRKWPMTISGWSSKTTVIPPRIPCASTVNGSTTAVQRSQRGRPGTRKAAPAAISVVMPTAKPMTRFPNST